MWKGLRSLVCDTQGNVAVITSIAIIPLLLAGAGTINFYTAADEMADAQGVLDAAALAALHPLNGKKPDPKQAIAVARDILKTHIDTLPDLLSAKIEPNVGEGTVHITYSSTIKKNINVVVWDGKVNYTVQATAKLQKKTLPVCILIMEETEKHTLFALGSSKIHFDNCIVQVDTENWDAVEGRDSSEIISTNGQHCFNGEIHRGTVLPPRADINSCTFFPDPFMDKAVPAADLVCDFNDVVVTTPQTLEAGTYCGGLEISANVTFESGLIVIKDGPFSIQGGTTRVNAPKNTIALVGREAVLDFRTGTSASLSIQAPKDGEVGPLDGFAIFADQPALATSRDAISNIVNTNIDMSGILYMRRHELRVRGNAVFKANPGAIVADYLITNGNAFVDVYALPMGSAGYGEMLKVIDDVATPVLVK